MARDSTKPLGGTTYKETAFGTIPQHELLIYELEGTKKGLEFIYSLVANDGTTEITPELIKKIHSVSFAWIFPDWGGKFRTIQVTYSEKEAPNYFQVPELITTLCEDLKIRRTKLPNASDVDFIHEVVSLLAWFQHQFVFIHPFQDYNGRIARMLTLLLLLQFKLPPVEISVESDIDRTTYLEAMYQGDEGDLLPLEKLISTSLTKELNKGI